MCHAIEDLIADAGQLDRVQADLLEVAWEAALANVKEYVERDQSRIELHSADLSALRTLLH